MKKIISLLLFAAVLTSVAGCEAKNNKSDTNSSAVQTEFAEYKTIEPPADGWTVEGLLSVTYLCDKQLSYPLTVDSMGEGFEIAENSEMVHEHDGGSKVDAELWYNNEFLGIIFLPTEKVEDVTNDMPIDHFTVNVHSDVYKNSGKAVSVNGVAFGDSKDDLIKALGTPSDENESTRTLTYQFQNDYESKLLIGYDSECKFDSISFYYLNGMYHSSDEQTESAGYKTIEPPADGWTTEELLSVTYLCDKQLSYPLTVESLGEDFSLGDKDSLITDLCYKGDTIGRIILGKEDDETSDNLNAIKYFNSVSTDNLNIESSDYISVNGVTIGDTEEDILKKLGEPDVNNRVGYVSTIEYYDKTVNDTCIRIFLHKDNITDIAIKPTKES